MVTLQVFFMMIHPSSQEKIGFKVFERTCQQNMKASLFSLLVLITILTKMYPNNNVNKNIEKNHFANTRLQFLELKNFWLVR